MGQNALPHKAERDKDAKRSEPHSVSLLKDAVKSRIVLRAQGTRDGREHVTLK